jgi:lipoate-protein ligase A
LARRLGRLVPSREWEIAVDGALGLDDIGARDERAVQRGPPGIRVSWAREAWLSLGISQDPSGPLARRARAEGFRVHHRSSGGTAVPIHPGDLLFSIVLPRDHPLAKPPVTRAYGRLGAGVQQFLRRIGIDGRWSDPLGLSSEFCPFGSRGSPFVVQGRVLGGAAQHLTRGYLLHHGFLFRTVDRELLHRWFGIEPRVISGHVTSTEDLGVAASASEMAAGLLADLQNLSSSEPGYSARSARDH